MAESDLQKRLEQLGRRLVEDIERWELATRERRRETLNHLGAQLAKVVDVVEKERVRKETRRERRHREREERAAKKREEASAPVGLAQMAAALAIGAFAVLRPDLWWLIFVSLGLLLGGVRQWSLASERRRLERGAKQPTHSTLPSALPGGEDHVHEVDLLCQQLLADLETAPEAVRQFVQRPEATIGVLRTTARALDERRKQLLAEAPKERLAQLREQETLLGARRDAASDTMAKAKLDEALASVRNQSAAVQQLLTATERIDGEYTSLLVSLQELRTRVALAKTAGTQVQLDGLKGSVRRLNDELEAISDALTHAAAGTLQPISPLSAEPEAASAPQAAAVRTQTPQ